MRTAYFILFLALLFLKTNSGHSQELRYKTVFKGDSIGFVNVTKTDSLEYQVYDVLGDVRFWFFGTKTIYSFFNSAYQGGLMIKGKAGYVKNGELIHYVTTTRKDNEYLISGVDEVDKINQEIHQSVATLYHHEPKGLSSIYSERYGIFIPIRELGDGHYEVEKPNGRATEYFYEDGQCKQVKVENFFIRVTFDLIE